jgi:hypothetical protein
MMQLAEQYKKSTGVRQAPGEFVYDKDKDVYRGLRNAILFSDPQHAASEIDKVLKSGVNLKDISDHFRRYAHSNFTGSKKNEIGFYNSLSEDNKKIYQAEHAGM